MTDPQGMSDYLAEHLLGWRLAEPVNGKPYWETYSASSGAVKNRRPVACSAWHPHTDIAQCFEYIIPAMRKRGFVFDLFDETTGNEIGKFPALWIASFNDYHSANHTSDNYPPSAAIVEAAYKAIKNME